MTSLADPWFLIVAAPLIYLWLRLGRGAKNVRILRAVIIVTAVLILASPFYSTKSSQRNIVLLIDKSLSCGIKAMAAAEEYSQYLADRMSPEDSIKRVVFGDEASVLADSSSMSAASGLEDSSDLNAGIELSCALVAGKEGSRIVIISDGLYTGLDPMGQAATVLSEEAHLDFAPIIRDGPGDVAIVDVRINERVLRGHPFELSFNVRSPISREAVISVSRQGSRKSQKAALSPGDNRFIFTDLINDTSLVRYMISASVESDPIRENNTALGVTNVVGPPNLLVINKEGAPTQVTRAIETAGMETVVCGKGSTFSSADLKPFAAVVLENIALSDLNSRIDKAIRNYVRDLGGGLLVTGGRRSFAQGGYYQSRLEDVLPVEMIQKDEMRKSKIAICMVLDRSGSMGVHAEGGKTKMDLANRAVVEAINVLTPNDEVAVIAVDSSPHTFVPLTPLKSNLEDITSKTLSIESMGGGIFIYEGLTAGVKELLKSTAKTRHIALFADAADSEEPGEYKSLIAEWSNAGGTISVIGLGEEKDCDADLLKEIASLGGGSAFFTNDPTALPRIFCEDTIKMARKTFIDDATDSIVSPEIIRIGRLGVTDFPNVLGYNLCYTKEDAIQLITTTDENQAPILAVRQSGLGRTAALACEGDGPFTGDLRSWPEYQVFFSSIIKWLKRERDDISLFGTVVRSGNSASIVLEMDDEAAKDCTTAQALIIPPNEGDAIKLPLQWKGPNRMEAQLKLSGNGIYHGVVLTNKGKRVSLPPVVLPYSPEFSPRDPAEGLKALSELSKATGGKQVLHVDDLMETPEGSVKQQKSLAPHLAGLLLVLLLCDIITRKHLWEHLTPAFVARSYKRAVSINHALIERIKRMKRIRPRATKDDIDTVEVDEQKKPLKAVPDSKESVFKKAKRRSRS